MIKYKLSLFDISNKSMRDILITKNEYDFLIEQWEKPLKKAIALCEYETDNINVK